MAPGVEASRRKYHSPLREDQAQQTRERALTAALSLFVDRGYAGTTVAAVAELAGISPETIYLALGGKRGLLEAVISTAIGGDSLAAEDEKIWNAIEKLSDPRQRLEKIVKYSCEILARTRPIHAVIRGAADKEKFAADLNQRLIRDRLGSQTERIRRYLKDDLRPELSVAQAGQRYSALASPELYYLLTVEFGWTPLKHRTWITKLLVSELL
jgi:AcrR family transcriptional regulator